MLLPLLAVVAAAQSTPNFTEVTIYNQGFGVVKEDRMLHLKTGRQTVAIENVAAQIQPDSVGFKSITDGNALNVLEQNYQYDLISPTAILNKAVGSKIRFIRVLPNSAKEVLTGVLMSSPTAVVASSGGDYSQMTYNGMVIKTDDGRIVLNPTGEVEVDSIPEGLISRPTLLWDVDSQKEGDDTVELSYITNGMNWNATYVLNLGPLGDTADLLGWVTLDNQSGATYKDARLKLLAGEVHTAPTPRKVYARAEGAMNAPTADNFQEQSLFEYHLYTLQRPTTIHDKETKQVSLLEGHGVKVVKKLILDALQDVGQYYPSEGEVGTGTMSPQVRLEFQNSKDNGLGMPLPQGKMRIYQRDSSGSVQLLGEDNIKHTPKDEKISLIVGRSFDVVGERKRTDFHRLSDRSFSETFEITVRNHKDVDQDVILLERHYGTWTITSNTDPFTKLDANTMQFVVNVPANGSKVVRYTVETSW